MLATMAVIHHTTLVPSKLELLASWLPSQPWYAATGAEPDLAKAGGFRLDDPDGAVGIEFMIVTDQSGRQTATYHVPLAYRGAPLAGAADALVGETEHGVLGRRWVYDGERDPVLMAQLAALVRGSVAAQAQSLSETADRSVVAHLDGPDLDSTDLAVADLRVLRRLERGSADAPASPAGSRGYVEAGWVLPDGSAVRGYLVVALGAPE
jgi:Maltokinase N-terminal cap domain